MELNVLNVYLCVQLVCVHVCVYWSVCYQRFPTKGRKKGQVVFHLQRAENRQKHNCLSKKARERICVCKWTIRNASQKHPCNAANSLCVNLHTIHLCHKKRVTSAQRGGHFAFTVHQIIYLSSLYISV